MLYKTLIVPAFIGALSFSAGFVSAAEQEEVTPQMSPQMSQGTMPHGHRLMTPEERSEHRAKMRAAKTHEERKQIREEQHKRIKARAKEQGITLPDKPPMMGGRMGPGGMGAGGMGAGGMGTGRRGMMAPGADGTMAPSNAMPPDGAMTPPPEDATAPAGE